MKESSEAQPKPLQVKISYEELYSLIGQLLNINDATARDERQLKATKQLIKQTAYSWIDELYAEQYPKEQAAGEFATPRKVVEVTENLTI